MLRVQLRDLVAVWGVCSTINALHGLASLHPGLEIVTPDCTHRDSGSEPDPRGSDPLGPHIQFDSAREESGSASGAVSSWRRARVDLAVLQGLQARAASLASQLTPRCTGTCFCCGVA